MYQLSLPILKITVWVVRSSLHIFAFRPRDVHCLSLAVAILFYSEFHPFIFRKRAKAFYSDGCLMNEHVAAFIIWHDETVTFDSVKPVVAVGADIIKGISRQNKLIKLSMCHTSLHPPFDRATLLGLAALVAHENWCCMATNGDWRKTSGKSQSRKEG